jgi:4-amino-4-deoxy-L-arabinose transferase-like glycosyltransferase
MAAAYPGFWVLDALIVAEPLCLLVGGVLMLVLADLWERPTLARAVVAGAVSGAAALVRSEQVLLLGIAVAPVLLLNRRITVHRRLAWPAVAVLAALVPIAPWTIHNSVRFENPVVLSTNLGLALHAGNCSVTTYRGELMGFYDGNCSIAFYMRNLTDLDEAKSDIELRRAAFDNMRDNIDRLSATVLARYGRTLGVFRPTQTVGFTAAWAGGRHLASVGLGHLVLGRRTARRLWQRAAAPLGDIPVAIRRAAADRAAGGHGCLRRTPIPHTRGPRPRRAGRGRPRPPRPSRRQAADKLGRSADQSPRSVAVHA